MDIPVNRRSFLTTVAVGAVAAAASPVLHAQSSANSRVRLAIMGTNGRGLDHIRAFLSVPNTEIAYICDVDERAIQKGIAAVAQKQTQKPKGAADIRRVLDDPAVDAISVATPNHWHAPATILACAAGKHVYVEKPCCHNPREGELMIAAARKHQRVVQMGAQRRSWPWVIELVQRLRSGEFGKVFFSRTWYNSHRPSIGHGHTAPVPRWLDYSLWQGPAPERPFKDNLIHYNWHWHWHWGNGELGNNGIHALDVARWGLGVEYPTRVSCVGSRYHFRDDQETPDIAGAQFDFGEKGACWDGHSCDPHGLEGEQFGIMFYVEKGAIAIAGNGYKIFNLENRVVASENGRGSDAVHFANFIDCVRNGGKPNCDIEEGVKSTLLCHLGNIAYRTGHTLNIDPKTGKILGDPDAQALWTREYRPGWEPQV